VPLTLRLALRQRVASCARLTDFVGSFRSWTSASERVPKGGISTEEVFVARFRNVMAQVRGWLYPCDMSTKPAVSMATPNIGPGQPRWSNTI